MRGAADPARLKSVRIGRERNSALRQISACAYFVKEDLPQTVVTPQALARMEENASHISTTL